MIAVIKSQFVHSSKLVIWLPLVVLPGVVLLMMFKSPAWVFMWGLAFSIYTGLKWLSFADYLILHKTSIKRSLGYLLFWPGMNAKTFLTSSQHVEPPRLNEWLLAVAKTVFGLALFIVALHLRNQQQVIAGWIGMTGMVFTLHFGLFHILSILWRRTGVDAPPIMNNPILATSLSDFWGKRWNLAFRDLSHRYVFQPFSGKLGIAGTTMVVFVVSGIVHDIVISIPAGGGFGLPTLYFTIQGLGLLFERSRLGKRIGTRRGIVGRLFCVSITLGPVCLLFHPPFVERVVVPMFAFIDTIKI